MKEINRKKLKRIAQGVQLKTRFRNLQQERNFKTLLESKIVESEKEEAGKIIYFSFGKRKTGQIVQFNKIRAILQSKHNQNSKFTIT